MHCVEISPILPQRQGGIQKGRTTMKAQNLWRSFALLLAAALLLWRFGGPLGEAVYHSSEAGRFIRLLAPLVPIMYTDMIVDGCLKGLGQQVWSMGINILDAGLGVLLVYTLLPIGALDAYIGIIYFNELLNLALSAARLRRAVK